MPIGLPNLAIGLGGILPSDTLRNYLVRYRFALYCLPPAVVAAGIGLELHWLTASTLLRIITALPCMLMMFRCMSCVTGGANEATPRPERASSSPTS